MFKLGFAFLAVFCMAQVLGAPQHAPRTLPQRLTKDGRGLIEDIIAAEKAINDFIAACDALYNQVVTSTANSVQIVTTTTNTIIGLMGELGLTPEEIASIQQSADECVANIEAIATGLLTDITNIVDILNDMLKHLDNPIALALDLAQLEAAIDKMKLDFSTAYERTLAELNNLKNDILAVLVGHNGPIVDQIYQEIANAEAALMAEINAVRASFDACMVAAEEAILAINKLIP